MTSGPGSRNAHRRVPASATRLLAAAALLSLAACSTGAATSVGGVYTGDIDGAAYRVEVPPNWNGTLLLWSHGWYPPGLTLPEIELANQPATGKWLLEHGYALAASNYRTPNGFAVKEALGDQEALLDWFERSVGRPERVIAWGNSMGGLVSVLLGERSPQRFDGVVSLCGPLANVGFWNTALDLAFAVKTLLAPDLEVVHITDLARNTARARQVVEEARASSEGRARLALANALADVHGWFRALQPRPTGVDDQIQQQVEYALIGPLAIGGGGRAELEPRAGGNPSWNVGVDYRHQLSLSSERALAEEAYRQAGLDLGTDLERLAAAPRVAADPSAAEWLARYGAPRGSTPAPVVTVHTVGDGGAAPEHERWYEDRVGRFGDPSRLRQLFADRGGHCAFTASEEIVALQTLEQRVDSGGWPDTDPAVLTAAAAGVGTEYQEAFDWGVTWQYRPAQPRFVSFTPSPFLRPAARPSGER